MYMRYIGMDFYKLHYFCICEAVINLFSMSFGTRWCFKSSNHCSRTCALNNYASYPSCASLWKFKFKYISYDISIIGALSVEIAKLSKLLEEQLYFDEKLLESKFCSTNKW